MIGDKIRRKVEELNAVKKARGLIEGFKGHEKRTYPYVEEDNEGITRWLSPRMALLKFNGITIQEGYKRTVDKFKYIQRIHKTSISIEGDYIVVSF
jgi:hypothetical protein